MVNKLGDYFRVILNCGKVSDKVGFRVMSIGYVFLRKSRNKVLFCPEVFFCPFYYKKGDFLPDWFLGPPCLSEALISPFPSGNVWHTWHKLQKRITILVQLI